MSNIIKFPRNEQAEPVAPMEAVASVKPVKVSNAKGKAFLAGVLTFLLHFAVLTALTYFVSIYKPKGI